MDDARMPFQFSASSLQDYLDCPRRFQLRYAWQVAWPAPEMEPAKEQEQRTRLGQDLHRLIHQHLLGVPAALLSAGVHHPQLARWWHAYLAFAPSLGDASVLPETGLSVPLAGHRLYAQYDALVAYVAGAPHSRPVTECAADEGAGGPGTAAGQAQIVGHLSSGCARWLIVDWKTYRRHPGRQWLANRLQTRVYPLVLALAGASLNLGRAIDPEQVELRYWLAEYPGDVVSFAYSQARLQLDITFVTDLMELIASQVGVREGSGSPAAAWPLTADRHQCLYCSYRSLCRRGAAAGRVDDCWEDEDRATSPGSEDRGFIAPEPR
jgi:hypothetical protein